MVIGCTTFGNGTERATTSVGSVFESSSLLHLLVFRFIAEHHVPAVMAKRSLHLLDSRANWWLLLRSPYTALLLRLLPEASIDYANLSTV